MTNRKSKRVIRDLALQRIRWLYRLSIDAVKRNDTELARRYVHLIFLISRKTNTRLPRSIKRRICKKCNIPLIPGVTASFRLRSDGKSSWILVRCLQCGWMHRYPYKPRKKVSVGRGGK